MQIAQALDELTQHPDFQLLRRVPTTIKEKKLTCDRIFTASIIDLETMGLDAKTNEIIEMGVLSFTFSSQDGILASTASYNELNDPGKPIPEEVTKVTGITDADVTGKTIDWNYTAELFEKSDLLICHNSQFDRNFLELQTPDFVKTIIENKPFACTIYDIDWKERGYESSKLDYLNWKLGFFYEGHRALSDCWATLNLLIQEAGAFDELKANVRKKEALICATHAPFEKKDRLKERGYRWSDGSAELPKCWWTTVSFAKLEAEKQWLNEEIYAMPNAGDTLPQSLITARKRYSFRAKCLSS